MTPGDQNYVLHLTYPQSKSTCEGEPGVDMPSNPCGKITLCESVLTLSCHGKDQCSTAPP